MKIIISLDYELFFGQKIGTPENCLIRPVTELLKVLDKYNIKLSLFVDVGYLLCLKRHFKQYPALQSEYDTVCNHLKELDQQGHDIQLHIHPHWEDTIYDGKNWQFDFSRYRLHDFSSTEINRIVAEYKQELEQLTSKPVFAFRAGGWCIQPFEQIAGALYEHGIWLDSTAYNNGLSTEPKRWFDFSNMPTDIMWRFDNDLLIRKENGRFLEVPISAVKVSPLFFWKFLFSKILKQRHHRSYGDGIPLRWTKSQYLKMLTSFSYSVASIDGKKADLVFPAYRQLKQSQPDGVFNLIGHPKALSPYSIKKLQQFLSEHRFESTTFQDYKNEA